jgi:hypothetical protein
MLDPGIDLPPDPRVLGLAWLPNSRGLKHYLYSKYFLHFKKIILTAANLLVNSQVVDIKLSMSVGNTILANQKQIC